VRPASTPASAGPGDRRPGRRPEEPRSCRTGGCGLGGADEHQDRQAGAGQRVAAKSSSRRTRTTHHRARRTRSARRQHRCRAGSLTSTGSPCRPRRCPCTRARGPRRRPSRRWRRAGAGRPRRPCARCRAPGRRPG
jgi:hypothetical protein